MRTAKELMSELDRLLVQNGQADVKFGDSKTGVFETIQSMRNILASLEERLVSLESSKFCTCPPGLVAFDGESQ